MSLMKHTVLDNMSSDMVAACLLTSLASMIGARVGVKPKKYSKTGHSFRICGAVLLHHHPARSPAFNAGTLPIDRLVAEARRKTQGGDKEI